jgi:hypothetical protein
MRRFWWATGIIFVVSFAVYLVGGGWMAASSAKSALVQARRQIEVDPVLQSLDRAQAALARHRQLVQTFPFVLRNPDLKRTEGVASDLTWFQQDFGQLKQMPSDHPEYPTQFQAAMDRLNQYHMPSVSVLSPLWEGFLKVLVLVSLLVTLAAGAVRAFAGAD